MALQPGATPVDLQEDLLEEGHLMPRSSRYTESCAGRSARVP